MSPIMVDYISKYQLHYVIIFIILYSFINLCIPSLDKEIPINIESRSYLKW